MPRVKPAWLNAPQVPCGGCGRGCWSKATPPLCRACRRRVVPRRPERSAAERKRRALVVAEWRAQHGDLCPGYQCEAHWATPPKGTNPLTADHLVPYARTGDESTPLGVLCRSCNSRKRDRPTAARPAPTLPPEDERPAWYSSSRMWTAVYPEPSGTC